MLTGLRQGMPSCNGQRFPAWHRDSVLFAQRHPAMGTARVAHMQRLVGTYNSCLSLLCLVVQGASQQSAGLVGHWGGAAATEGASCCAAGLDSIQLPRLTFRRALQKPKLVLCPNRVTCSQVDTLREKRPSSSVLHCSSTKSEGSGFCMLSR